MPRYVIEMDEPKTCCDCPCFWCGVEDGYAFVDDDALAECNLAQKEITRTDVGEYVIPTWCPLKPLD